MTLAFMLTRLSGDLAISIAGPSATQADVEIIRKAYGLDRPVYVQFFSWVGRAMVGDFGQSYFFKDSVSNLIARRLPITLTLGLTGLNSRVDHLDSARHPGGGPREHLGRPRGHHVHDGGAGDPELLARVDPDDRARSESRHPADLRHRNLAAFRDAGHRARLYGDPGPDAADALRHDRGDGVRLHPHRAGQGPVARRIIFKHALRNAAIPVVSIAAVQLGFMLGGSIVIETVFALHGVGYLGWESIAKNDFPVVQAVVLVLAAIYIGLTLLSDILNALLDPRLRTG